MLASVCLKLRRKGLSWVRGSLGPFKDFGMSGPVEAPLLESEKKGLSLPVLKVLVSGKGLLGDACWLQVPCQEGFGKPLRAPGDAFAAQGIAAC